MHITNTDQHFFLMTSIWCVCYVENPTTYYLNKETKTRFFFTPSFGYLSTFLEGLMSSLGEDLKEFHIMEICMRRCTCIHVQKRQNLEWCVIIQFDQIKMVSLIKSIVTIIWDQFHEFDYMNQIKVVFRWIGIVW